MLPRAPRVLRRSVAPALGTASSTGCELVAACTVLMPAVIMSLREVALEQRPHHVRQRGRRARGRRDELVPRRVELVVVDAVDRGWRRRRAAARPCCLLLKGELCTTTAAPAARWPRSDAAWARRPRRAGRGTCRCTRPPAPRRGRARGCPWGCAPRAGRRSPCRRRGCRPSASSTTSCRACPSGRAGSGAAGRRCCPWRGTGRRTRARCPPGAPVLTTKRSKSSRPRWCQSVSLPMRPRPLMPRVRCIAAILLCAYLLVADRRQPPRRHGPLRRPLA